MTLLFKDSPDLGPNLREGVKRTKQPGEGQGQGLVPEVPGLESCTNTELFRTGLLRCLSVLWRGQKARPGVAFPGGWDTLWEAAAVLGSETPHQSELHVLVITINHRQ